MAACFVLFRLIKKRSLNLLCVLDDKIVNQLRPLFFFNDAMIAALCSKSKRFNESMAKWFHGSGSST